MNENVIFLLTLGAENGTVFYRSYVYYKLTDTKFLSASFLAEKVARI